MTKKHCTSIGERIMKLREHEGITQKELAKKIGTTQSAIARMESGKQNISSDMLKKIGDALHRNLLTSHLGSMNVVVNGGKKLTGTIATNTSKNGAVGLLCASLINKGRTTLHRVPKIEEVNRIIEVMESIGVSIKWQGSTVIITPPKKFDLSKIDTEAAKKTRSIVMFIGPLLHHLQSFSLPQSGGCKLGSRTIQPHLYSLENFGVDVKTSDTDYSINQTLKTPSEIILYESGDTVTENTIFMASKISDTVTIKYASANYMVQEVCHFMEILGVKIEGIGQTTLKITGLHEISKDVEYTLSEDPTDSMFFITAAIVTDSHLTVTHCPIDFLELELLKLEKMGLKYEKSKTYISKNGFTKLVDIEIKPSNLKALSEKIYARPYPGLNIDNLPFFAVIATKAQGQTLIHDWVYEKRAIYFTELDKLGAETVLADPHRIFINGKTELRPAELICPPALRPATIILLAMLASSGQSILRNIYSINRGYENLVERLRSLGADIDYITEF